MSPPTGERSLADDPLPSTSQVVEGGRHFSFLTPISFPVSRRQTRSLLLCALERGTQTEGRTAPSFDPFTSVEIQRHQVSRSATWRAKAGGMKEVTHRYEKITPESRANFSDDEGSLTGYNEPPPDKVRIVIATPISIQITNLVENFHSLFHLCA